MADETKATIAWPLRIRGRYDIIDMEGILVAQGFRKSIAAAIVEAANRGHEWVHTDRMFCCGCSGMFLPEDMSDSDETQCRYCVRTNSDKKLADTNLAAMTAERDALVEKLRADEEITDPLCKPIARRGEQQFAAIVRNRSGQDAGAVDMSVRCSAIKQLSKCDQADAVSSAWCLLESVLENVSQDVANENVWWLDRIAKRLFPSREQNQQPTTAPSSDAVEAALKYADKSCAPGSMLATLAAEVRRLREELANDRHFYEEKDFATRRDYNEEINRLRDELSQRDDLIESRNQTIKEQSKSLFAVRREIESRPHEVTVRELVEAVKAVPTTKDSQYEIAIAYDGTLVIRHYVTGGLDAAAKKTPADALACLRKLAEPKKQWTALDMYRESPSMDCLSEDESESFFVDEPQWIKDAAQAEADRRNREGE